jgi:archaellum biogenesis ATPase FlaH
MNKILSDLEKSLNLILSVPEEKYQLTINALLKELVSAKKSVCFVSVNKTKKTIEKELKKEEISTEKIYFIDCVSKSISKGKVSWSDEKTQYIDNPNALTQMSLAIFKLFEKNKIDFLILDSINTLLIYNNEKEILKFVHHTTGKLKEGNKTGVFIYLKEEGNGKMLKKFSQFTDKIIESTPPIKKEFIRKKGSMDSFEEIKL